VRKATSDFLEVITLKSPERRYDTVFLSNYALLNLYDSLARVKGVGQVRIFGARDYSMRIWLDPEKMAHRGVTAIDVSNIVREQNVIAPAGSIGLPPCRAASSCSTPSSSRGASPRPPSSRTSSSASPAMARSFG